MKDRERGGRERGESNRENEVTEKYRRELIKNRRSEQSNREERELGFDIGNRGMVFTLNVIPKSHASPSFLIII